MAANPSKRWVIAQFQQSLVPVIRIDEEGRKRFGEELKNVMHMLGKALRTLGARPQEMLSALRELAFNLAPGGDPDALPPIIAATLRRSAADTELKKVEQLGAIALAVFERVAAAEGDARGLFADDPLGACTASRP